MRLFLAVEISDTVRAAAAEAADALRHRIDVDARWISPGNLHITLWFFGEVADAQVRALTSALDTPLPVAPFEIELGGLGAFPPKGPPRVLWLGVRSGHDRLAALHRELAARLSVLGFEPERRGFSAHLTLARVRELRPTAGGNSALRRALTEAPAAGGHSPVTHVTLFRSRLSPKGASYEAVLRVPLQG